MKAKHIIIIILLLFLWRKYYKKNTVIAQTDNNVGSIDINDASVVISDNATTSVAEQVQPLDINTGYETVVKPVETPAIVPVITPISTPVNAVIKDTSVSPAFLKPESNPPIVTNFMDANSMYMMLKKFAATERLKPLIACNMLMQLNIAEKYQSTLPSWYYPNKKTAILRILSENNYSISDCNRIVDMLSNREINCQNLTAQKMACYSTFNKKDII